ncbi:MAG TPA: class I SAM-dependent methyltransferase [Pirellulales bacterium]|nr:class I SAM-dependent methyltransferase [Pirellulales bacterium]
MGGFWERIGLLQFNFLKTAGLQPNDILLDVGCGALRGGIHFINYLDAGCYLGIDQNADLIQAGLTYELGKLQGQKTPEFVVSKDFEFSKFSKKPTFAIAQSLFTHLDTTDIAKCLTNLRAFVDHCQFYTTFHDGDPNKNPPQSVAKSRFYYPNSQLIAIGIAAGWSAQLIGNWNHPRGQVMMKFSV